MNYKLRKGIVVFSMCGQDFIFPSREGGKLLSVILTLPPGLADALRADKTIAEQDVSPEEAKKLQRLATIGYLEVC